MDPNNHLNKIAAVVSLIIIATNSLLAVPAMLQYQGRVAVNGVNFNGSGQFKFALADAAGAIEWWSKGVLVVPDEIY